jgi:two-component system chemotaxis response regulator CheB
MRALELGAFDFILKPQARNYAEGKNEIKRLIHPMIQAFARSKIASGLLGNTVITSRQRSRLHKTALGKDSPSLPVSRIPPKSQTLRKGKSEIVTIGISTGGPNALTQMLPHLPGEIGVPILIVQHMPPIFTKSLAQSLDKKCALTVKEAEDGEAIANNIVYIAPGGKQMKLIASNDGKNRLIRITNDPPENSCKPSADYLFRSIGDYFVGRSTAVIMTGMGSDGTKGLEILKSKGSHIIAQNEETCIVYGMPKAPVEMGLVDVIAPLNKIADEIIKSVRFA